MKARFVLRVRLLSGIFVLAALLLVVRLYFVQMVHGDEYREKAAGQYVDASVDSERRGDIFFTKRDGTEVAAAVMQSGWRIAIKPGDILDADAAYQSLNSIVPIDKARFMTSAAKRDDPYEEVAFRIDDDTASLVRAKKLDGVITVRDEWRTYPAADLAAHAVGFVGFQGDRRVGVYGIERYYEDTLQRGSSGLYVNPFAEIFTNVAAAFSSSPTLYEGSVITSIDPDAQIELERVIEEVAEKYSSRQVGGVVMDPKTGAIVAMAVAPDFDPNTYNTAPSAAVFSNPIVESVYEMGSILKPLTMAAAIDVGVVTPKTTYYDQGYVMKSGFRISNFDGKGRGVVPMQEVLSQSLNTGIAFIVDRMGHETWGDYVDAFGLGEETGIDLPNEVAGNTSALSQQGASDVDFASAGFGQGIAVTPIAMIRALGALANHGVLPEPHIASSIRYPSGVERDITQAPPTRVLKEETVDTVTNMLVEVFDKALLKGELKQEHYSIAAKTGTAQIGGPGCNGYCDGKFLHSFFGYFPAHEARFIVLLYQVEPQGVEYASQSLARPFMEIAKFLINYYQIPPDR